MAFKHGLARRGKAHPLFRLWYDMLHRCSNPNKDNYKHYGGRGIKVCERWQDFPNFVSDMGDRPDGYTLDRINPDGDYEPSNCRWASKIEQANNTRANRILIVQGESMTLAEAERRFGVKRITIHMRIKKGWDVERAVLTPTRPHKVYELKRQTQCRIQRAQDGIR